MTEHTKTKKNAVQNMILFFVQQILSEMVRFRFATNLELYLVMYSSSSSTSREPMFTATSQGHYESMSNYCSKAALRKVGVDDYLIYFCGRKMCVDTDNYEIKACVSDEHSNVWYLQKVDDLGLYLLRIDDVCISLKYGKVYMSDCNTLDLSQSFYIMQDGVLPKYLLNDDFGADMKTKRYGAKAYVNDIMYKNISILEGNDFQQKLIQ